MTGTVTIDGEPLPRAYVVYTPDPANPNLQRTMAVTDEKGAYALTTSNVPGAAKGRYKVTIFLGKVGPVRDDVPFHRKYSSPDDTPLIIQVDGSPTAGAFDLKLEKKSQ